MSDTTDSLPISADLLEILRDPRAVQEPDRYGPDPGRLELAHNSWLVSQDTGYKYPIIDGIPVMLIDEGEHWKDTPVEALPVPPVMAGSSSPAGSDDLVLSTGRGGVSYAVMALTLLVGVVIFLAFLRRLLRRS